MDSKVLVSAILFASCFYVGVSQQEPSGIAELEFDCMESFMPCQSYLQSSSSPPPSSCCTPMKKMVETNKKCFCAVFDNVPLLKTLNVTQEDALKLPEACEAKADITVCKSLKKEGYCRNTIEGTTVSDDEIVTVYDGNHRIFEKRILEVPSYSAGLKAMASSLRSGAAKTISSATAGAAAGATGGASESDSQGGSGGSASSTGTSSSTSSAHGLSSLSKNGVILSSMVAWMLIFV